MSQSLNTASPYLHSKKRSRTIAVPVASVASKSVAAPVMSVEVETPTYLEVPDFQRVAIIGDYASGVLFTCLIFALIFLEKIAPTILNVDKIITLSSFKLVLVSCRCGVNRLEKTPGAYTGG